MGEIVFARATRADDPDIRRLLRENPLGGRYSVSLEREPSAFAAPFDHDFVLARDRGSGAAIGLYERTVWPVFVNGRIERIPYLGALRVAESHRHRVAILRAGYASLRSEFEAAGDYPVALTSITADNAPATRILTAGLRGLPVYQPLAPFSTFVMRPVRRPRDPAVVRAADSDLPEIADFLARQNARYQFAPAWTADILHGLAAFGLPIGNFLIVRAGGRIAGCIALWDMSNHRQSVIRGYPALVGAVRPLANRVGALFGWPDLPPVGAPIRQVMLSHLGVTDDAPAVFEALLDAALGEAARVGHGAAILGMASDRALVAGVRKRRRAIEYRTMLYLVFWPGSEKIAAGIEGSLPHPDIGLL